MFFTGSTFANRYFFISRMIHSRSNTKIFAYRFLLSFFIRKKQIVIGIIIALLYCFLNPVTYFFNYSRILVLYEIGHPNYFYYVLFLEIFVLGIALTFSYRQTRSRYITTLEEKLNLEKENREITEQQEEKIKQSIIESHEHLLKNLSKDLHDDIGQKLSVISFSVENLRFAESGKESIGEIRNTILEISDSVRDLSHWLSDFKIGENTIDEILLNEIERLRKTNIINIGFSKINHRNENQKTSIEENVILYRCFQECFNNILKYSGANNVEVVVDFTKNLSISITDNGKGFDADNVSGNGIKNLKERTEIIGFVCEIHSETEKGTEVLIYKR